jgi:methionine-rich copper-binding protein CopC
MPHPARRSLRAFGILATLSGALLLPGTAAAHAALVSSSPAAGAVVEAPLDEVVLTFDEAVAGASSFSVLDTGGSTIATGSPDATDPTVMRASLPPLGGGDYKVEWTSVAQDGDVERGTFSFNVVVPAPPVGSPTPTTTPLATDSPTVLPSAVPTATPVPSAAGDGGTGSGTDVLLPIAIVGLLIGGGLALLLRRPGRA